MPGVRGGMGLHAEEAHLAETPATFAAGARVDAERWLADTAKRTSTDEAMDEEINVEDDDMNLGFIGCLAPLEEDGDSISELLLDQLGSCGRSFRREAKSAGRKIISEMYSPPRVSAELKKMRHKHLIPGFAFDLTVTDPDDGKVWDFSKKEKRVKALKIIRETKPYMVIGSPECKAFCTWMALNAAKSRNVEALRLAKKKAVAHIEFMIEVYYEQLNHDRYFLHEHPSGGRRFAGTSSRATRSSVPSLTSWRSTSSSRSRSRPCPKSATIRAG